MGMRIWALEKLQRMVSTINDEEIGGQHGYNARHNDGFTQKARNGLDLTQVLKNELVNGPSDRDTVSSAKDLVMFKGPFIYVHDMDEKTKPVMVRDYQKVARNQDGSWPQFRSAPLGRCPFLEEPQSRREVEKLQARQTREKERRAQVKQAHEGERDNNKSFELTHRTAATKPSVKIDEGAERDTESSRRVAYSNQSDVQKTIPVRRESPKKSSESILTQLPRAGPFYACREPAASGVQPSNVTSAIRSQMISSNACAPGAKAGTSKEVHELKRKVLEKSSVGLAAGRISSSHPPADMPTTLKAKAQESKEKEEKSRKEREREQERQRRRDPKPGFCENCRDKYEDFDTVSSRPLVFTVIERLCSV